MVKKMRPEDTISLAVYAGAAGEVLSPTSGAEKAKIYAAIENLQAGGSTNGGSGSSKLTSKKNKIRSMIKMRLA